MKKLVIFDLDGTLLNTINDLGLSCNHALEQCGFKSHPLNAYPFMVGNVSSGKSRKSDDRIHRGTNIMGHIG